jgi:hypothetical protein
MNKGATTSLVSLPADVLFLVILYLPNEDKASLRLSCQAARYWVDIFWQPLKGAIDILL